MRVSESNVGPLEEESIVGFVELLKAGSLWLAVGGWRGRPLFLFSTSNTVSNCCAESEQEPTERICIPS
jgi:hypothetical protein